MRRRILLRVGRVAYLLVLGVGLVWLVWTRRGALADLLSTARLSLLLVALFLGFGQIVLNSGFWQSSLLALDESPTFRGVLIASSRSLFARYVPGSLWYAAGKSALLARQGVAPFPLVITAGLEMFLSIVTVFVLGLGLLAAGGELPGGAWWALPPIAIGALVLSRPAVNRFIAWLARRRDRDDPPQLNGRAYLRLISWTIAYWLWTSTNFVIYLWVFPGLTTGPGWVLAGAFMVAWGIGFLTPIAPQGIGVFEVTLAALLVTDGITEVAVILGGFRALMLVRDALATAVGELNAAGTPRGPAGSRPTA